MSLVVHRSERADALVGGLADLLADAPKDPFAPDLVAVPSKGVERWIAQSLSAHLGAQAGRADGVCANVLSPSPSEVVREAVTAGLGIAVDGDPWAERRLPWPLLEVIDACAGEDWCQTLGRHLGLLDGAVDQGRRMSVAQKLARLFTSYGAQRPQMIRDWRDGRDTDGYGNPLDDDHEWQAELWRRLREHLGVESPAERILAACAGLRDEPGVVDLPERLSFFGPTRLTTDQLQVIDALSAHRDVHLWLPHPSDGLWRCIADAPHEVTARRDDPTADLPQHPLVRSLARDARELQLRLQTHTTPSADEHLGQPVEADTLLHALQSDIHSDQPPGAAHALAGEDTSVQVHACHGRQRQVEVLREVLLGLLEDDPTLELRDIIVMCPDIEAYAPLIAAAFGLSTADGGEPDGTHPGHRLTVRLADRSLRQTNPVLSVAARLLELADARLTASEVLDLAAMPPVRRRFGFDDQALERVGDWVRRAGVRWGLDTAGRDRFGLDEVWQNTWQTGLDRLLVGVTMDEDDLRTLDRALPLDDVDSTEIDLAGRLAELLDRLGDAVTALTREQPLEDWVTALADAVEVMVDVAPADAWQLSQARRQLTGALTNAEHHTGATLVLNDVRALLGEGLRGRPTRANFRTGHLTMCTMVPMRSVPHRVVCLLGVDDGVFPRGTRVDGDDILARTPRVGERDPRSEDRQLFLDAILAAKERLVVLYTGADERTGALRPPAVPLGELLDALDATAHTLTGRVRDQVVVRHPLQPFDPRNFQATDGGPFSFDQASYAGSRALLGDRPPQPAFLDQPLPPPDDPPDTIGLESLIRFVEHPARHFLRERLGLGSPEDAEEPDDAIPVAPDPLEKWAVGDRLLGAGLAGLPGDQAVRAELLRGQVPPGRLGDDLLAPVVQTAQALVEHSAGIRTGEPQRYDVSVALPSGITVAGTVPGVYGDCVVRVVYSRLSAKHRLRAWVQLLALVAQWPDRPWEAKTVGRGAKDRKTGQDTVSLSHLHGVTAEDARRHLDVLAGLYLAGLREPLPMPPKSAGAYAEKRAGSPGLKAAETKAKNAWRSGSGERAQGECTDAHHQRIWGDAEIDVLLATPPDPADTAWPDEPHRFGQLARTVWAPLLAAEEVHTR